MKVGNRNLIVAVIMLIASGLSISTARAVEVLELVEGQASFVEVSSRDLNLVRFPVSGVKIYTSSKVLNVKVDGNNVFVNFLQEGVSAPQEVFFVTAYGTYSMIFVPKMIPAASIIVKIPKEAISDAVEWETSHDHITGLKELMKAMYTGSPPMGYSIMEAKKEATEWTGTKRTLVRVFAGATLAGEIYEIENTSAEKMVIMENEFYKDGVLAVSVDAHDLGPHEKTSVYIVKKTEAQKKMEIDVRRINPLQALGEHRKE